jgi:hypothetical protein
MNEYSTAGRRETQARTELSSIKDEYRSWQHQQYANANQVWYANLATALNRYMEALNTEMVQRQAKSDMEIALAEAKTKSLNEQSAQRRATNTINMMEKRKESEMANSLGILGRFAYLTSR